MSKRFRIVSEFGSVVMEGSRSECKAGMKALKGYGIREDKFEMEEFEENRFGLTDKQIDKMCAAYASELCEINMGYSEVFDTMYSGFYGIDDMSLDEIVSDCEELDLCLDIVKTYKTNKAAHRMLTEEEE